MASNSNSKPVKIREFSLPQGDLGRKVLITGIVMLLSSRRELLQPGSPLHDYVLAGNPTLLKAARWIQNGLFYFLFGAHSIETPLGKALPILRAHGLGAARSSISPSTLGIQSRTNLYSSKLYRHSQPLFLN